MNRTKLLLIGLSGAFVIAGWVVVAHAQSFRSGSNVTVRSGQTINSTLFAAGSTIDIAGNVNGDVFCAGQNVHISGRVRGDVLCAGQNLTVSGSVSGDVRLAGQSVTLSGTVDGNATIASQSFVLQGDGSVGGDATIGGQDSTLNGKVGRDVAAGVRTLTITGDVGRNLQAEVTNLNLNNDAKVGGDVNYTSQNTLHKSGNAQVQGSTTRHEPTKPQKHMGIAVVWPVLLYAYVTAIVASLVLVLLFPRLFEHVARGVRGHLGVTFLVGLVAGILMPIILAGLMVTVVGIPLAILLGLVWLVVVLLSGPFAAYLLGRLLLRRSSNTILIMLVGSLILYLLYLLPIVGLLFWLVGTWFGIGAIFMQWHHAGRPSYRVGPLPTMTRGGNATM